ncbi:MAG: hypothetical protein R3E97_23250 [Candidatus Eisenbacteria bacterium]
MNPDRRDLIAQWAFDTRAVLGRFHVWLEDVEVEWIEGTPEREASFVGPSLEKALMVSTAVTALGTRLYGRYGEGKGQDKGTVNRVKKDADAISAYAMSESLWYLSRNLPENHAIMVSLGEGLMPKAGETPEMGANPLLGFGRVYARAEVAKFVHRRALEMINRPGYGWEQFWRDIELAGITIWGVAVDTLENTSRFANGEATGPMCVLHLFDQPLRVALPYEGYTGSLCLPNPVVRAAERRSVLANFHTPRALVLSAIQDAYPGLEPHEVHVYTLQGSSRATRLQGLWDEWRELGVHVVEEGWELPSGGRAFTESGTYAPTVLVGPYEAADGRTHLFLTDGYAASAEAIQAASLDPILGLTTSLCVFSSRFEVAQERERHVMQLDPDADDFATRLGRLLDPDGGRADTGRTDSERHAGDAERHAGGADARAESTRPGETRSDDALADDYRQIIRQARAAGMPLHRSFFTVDELFPKKEWRCLAISSNMLDEPYSGGSGVEYLGQNVYRVSVRASSPGRIREAKLTLRLMESFEESRRVFSPLLDRLYAGEHYEARAVKISDSGRIRNELETWCAAALEPVGESGVRLHLDRVEESVLSKEKKAFVREVLSWYKKTHPIWFDWLEIC